MDQKNAIKRRNEINKMDLLNVSFEILKHYTCPNECDGLCCKIYDIHFEQHDIRRISKSSTKNKEIISQCVYDPKFKNKVMPVQPCLFLKSGKCNIYKMRPMACQQYPFSYKEAEDGHILFCLETCLLGRDLLIDYTNFLTTLASLNQVNQQLAMDSVEVTRTVLAYTDSKVIELPNKDLMKSFLFYLDYIAVETILEYRNKFKESYLPIK